MISFDIQAAPNHQTSSQFIITGLKIVGNISLLTTIKHSEMTRESGPWHVHDYSAAMEKRSRL
jgi:hypothetical protein